MKSDSITWRRTFPDSEPGTDGVAVFEGRVIGRVREQGRGEPHNRDDPKPWLWSVTDVELMPTPCRLGREGKDQGAVPRPAGARAGGRSRTRRMSGGA